MKSSQHLLKSLFNSLSSQKITLSSHQHQSVMRTRTLTHQTESVMKSGTNRQLVLSSVSCSSSAADLNFLKSSMFFIQGRSRTSFLLSSSVALLYTHFSCMYLLLCISGGEYWLVSVSPLPLGLSLCLFPPLSTLDRTYSHSTSD